MNSTNGLLARCDSLEHPRRLPARARFPHSSTARDQINTARRDPMRRRDFLIFAASNAGRVEPDPELDVPSTPAQPRGRGCFFERRCLVANANACERAAMFRVTDHRKFGCGKGLRLPPVTGARWPSAAIRSHASAALKCDATLRVEPCRSSSAASVGASRTRRFAVIGRPACGKRKSCARLVIRPSPNGMGSSRGNRPATG